MRKEYVRVRAARSEEEPDAEHYLARTVYEDYELIDIGILDDKGEKIMARKRMDPIGFVRFK
jgi:hypothetical protein